MKVVISGIGTAVPQDFLLQQAALDFLINEKVESIDELPKISKESLSRLYSRSRINKRHTVLKNGSNVNLNSLEPLSSRMKSYEDFSFLLAREAVEEAISDDTSPSEITHIITVSCTGFYAPSLAIKLINEFNFSLSCHHINLGFMGCNAGVIALRTASEICRANTKNKVLIVCVELCSLHYNKTDSREHLVASALFGDGASAVIVASGLDSGININKSLSYTVPNSQDLMSWRIKDKNFSMTLKKEVISLIENNISSILENWLSNSSNLKVNDISSWIVHPGGVKILEAVSRGLALMSEDLRYSYDILENFGNISSTTVFFILKKFMEHNELKLPAVMIAFGPGITVEGILIN